MSATTIPLSSEPVRLSEIIGALSYALDITEGLPRGHSARCCAIGMRIAEKLKLDSKDCSALFYALLLKDAGCSSNASDMCKLFDADDLELKRNSKLIDWSSTIPTLGYVSKNAAPGQNRIVRAGKIAMLAAKAASGASKKLIQTRCSRGAEIANILELPQDTANAILSLDEHWNGAGEPLGLKGESIPLFARILCLCTTLEVFIESYDLNKAFTMLTERSGKWFDPTLVEAAFSFKDDTAFWRSLTTIEPMNLLGPIEPADQLVYADEDRLDRIALAFSKVIDAKSPYTAQHSQRVAILAAGIAEQMGIRDQELRDLKRAALLHGIGKLGVSNRILDKPDKPTDEEWAEIRLHPQYTYEILMRIKRFRSIAIVASSHHEKLDGSGYHRGLQSHQISTLSRILAVADMGEALSATRPYRQSLNWDEVLEILDRDAGTKICAKSVVALKAFLKENDISTYSFE